MDHRETFEAKLANLKLHFADLTQEARHLRMASMEHPNGRGAYDCQGIRHHGTLP